MNKILCICFILAVTVGCKKPSTDREYACELYKYDSLDLTNTRIGENVIYDHKVFGIKNHKLFLLNPDGETKRFHVLKLTGEDDMIIKIIDWKEGEYKLVEQSYDGKYPLLLQNDTLFFVQNNTLYYRVHGNTVKCTELALSDPMYNEMISEYGWYAIRTGGRILVSTNLNDWETIYWDKRGISKSMAFVRNTSGQVELLFSEYTPGAERLRHNVLKYNCTTKKTKKVITFYKADEGLVPFARHIHILDKDPYTGDIWIGTGDTDNESHVYRSTDKGETFNIVGTGSQKWRVLAFMFTSENIFWNMDSYEPQYMTRVKRSDLDGGMIPESKLKRFSIINGACWGTLNIKTSDNKDMIIMGSNNEGRIIDDYCRTYGIIIKNGRPEIYELGKIAARTQYTQMFPIGNISDNKILLYDHEVNTYHSFIVKRIIQ